jgi:hypothetical protein
MKAYFNPVWASTTVLGRFYPFEANEIREESTEYSNLTSTGAQI